MKRDAEDRATTTAAIRERGLIPGIWFEFEPCTEGTEAYKETAHQLHRHGKVLQVEPHPDDPRPDVLTEDWQELEGP